MWTNNGDIAFNLAVNSDGDVVGLYTNGYLPDMTSGLSISTDKSLTVDFFTRWA